jgi:hypothetical protein
MEFVILVTAIPIIGGNERHLLKKEELMTVK